MDQSQNQNQPQQPIATPTEPVVPPQPQVQPTVVSPTIGQPERQQTAQPVAMQPTPVVQPIQPAVQQLQPQQTIVETQPIQPQQPIATPTEPVVPPQPQVQPTVVSPTIEQPLSPAQQISAQPVPSSPTPVVQPIASSQFGLPPGGVQPQVTPAGQLPQKKTPLVTLVAKLTFRGDNEQRPTSKLGRVVGIIIVIVALIGSAGNVYAARHVQKARVALKEYSNPYAAKREEDIKKAKKDSGPEVQDLKDGKIDVSKLFDATLGQHAQDIKGEMNKQINISDGVSFAITGVTRDWHPSGDYPSEPTKGKQFVKIDVQIGYRGKEGSGSASNLKLLNSKGGYQDTRYITSSEENGLDGVYSLSPGSSASGWLAYEVDQGENISIVYESKGYDYDNSNGKEFVMKATVELK